MFQKAISNLEKKIQKIYKQAKRDSISVATANSKGLDKALAQFEKELHRIVSNEGKRFQKDLRDAYVDSYKSQTGASRRPLKQANQAINYPWSGMNYSQRLGKNYMDFVFQMRSEIIKTIKNGGTLSDVLLVIKKVEQKFEDRHNLLYSTEIRHFYYEGEIAGYKKNGVTLVQYLTVGDNRVCPECQALEEYNEGIYKIEEVPILPRHPRCRCKVIEIEGRTLQGGL